MSVVKSKGPIVNSGICRCCGSTKRCRLLNHLYEFDGEKEVYSDMIMDCFGLVLSHLDGAMREHLICATCVVRLREAKIFKSQVLQCEEAFLQMKIYDAESTELDLEIKKEQSSSGNESDELRSATPVNAEPSIKIEKYDSCSNDDEPLLNLRIKRRKDGGAKEADLKANEIENRVAGLKSDKVDVIQRCLRRRKTIQYMKQQRALQRERLLLKLKEKHYDSEKSYKVFHNVTTIIQNSHVCPFRCRHNNLLCYYCRKVCSSPEELRSHTNEHNPTKFRIKEYRTMIKVDVLKIDCRLCDAKIDDLDTFKNHIVDVHNKKMYDDIDNFVLPFILNKELIRCCMCEKTFLYFHAANMHMNEHFNNFMCETCGLGFIDQSRLLAHMPKHDKGSYACEECGKVFKTETYKELHVDRVHKKLGKVYCPKCDVRLMSYQQKLKHLVEVHGEEPLQLKCTACDKVFQSRRYLTLHLRKYHIKDYRHECQYCGQKFFTGSALRSHLPTHTGERNYKCKVCDKSYPRLKTLKEHTRIHTNDRRYRCDICGQAFIQNCSLKGHMRSQHPEYG